MRSAVCGIIGIMLVIAVCGCKEDSDELLAFDVIHVDKAITLEKTQNSPQCKVNMTILYMNDTTQKAKVVNDAIERKLFGVYGVPMREAANLFADRYMADFVKTLKPLYGADRNDDAKRSWYEYRYNILTETRKGRKGVTVYVINSEYYEGGVHGIEQQFAMNFDAESGRHLTLSDVFINGYEKRLNGILLSAIEKKFGAKDITELHELGYLRSTDIFAPENFVLGKKNITFIYNVYEIAPYDRGRTELEISYSDIYDLLKK